MGNRNRAILRPIGAVVALLAAGEAANAGQFYNPSTFQRTRQATTNIEGSARPVFRPASLRSFDMHFITGW